jgi:uncharacterized membrane protein YheB (UPF0754 family)
MIRDKRFKKFYEVGNNRYYVLPFGDELYLGTENFLEEPRKFFKKPKELTQTVKLLELSAPMLLLFNSVIDTKVVEVDEEFNDMCVYEKLDNSKLRKDIKESYDTALNLEIDVIRDDFNKWCENFAKDSVGKYTEEEIEDTIKANQHRIAEIIEQFKQMHISKFISTSVPNKKSENDVVKKMLTSGLEFMYSHQMTSNMKVYYLYDLDKFGTITIYKVVCVKEHIKAINSFVYDRKIAQELLAFIENNKL